MSVALNFDFTEPATVEEAVAQRVAHAASRYVAGGTDLVANLRRGIGAPELLIGLDGIADMKTIVEAEGFTRIGAGVTLAQLLEAGLCEDYPALSAAREIAGPSHREAATIGGNLCLDTRCVFYNQSEWWRKANAFCLKLDGDICHVAPQGDHCHAAFSGDLAPALLVLGAEVEIASPEGRDWQPLGTIYRDDGRDHLSLGPADLLVAVRIPIGASGLRSGYLKSRVRRSIDFPLAGVAVAFRQEGDAINDLRVAITGTNSRPFLLDGIEALDGQVLNEGFLDRLTKRIGQMIKPMRTTVMPGNYRRQVAGVYARRLITRLYEAGCR